MRRGAGRPSACTPKLIEQICDALVASNGSLTTLLTRRRTFPGASTLWRWCASDDAIREQISRAKECQAERMQGDTFEKLHDVIADAHDRMAAGTAVDSQLLGVLARHADSCFHASVKLAGQYAPREYGVRSRVELGLDVALAEQLDDARARMLADRAAQSDCLDGVPPATPLPAQASSG
jgi:hypothetical protein